MALRKHAFSNILKILPLKTENFQKMNSDMFHISAQNIDFGYSLEPPRRGNLFLSRNMKISKMFFRKLSVIVVKFSIYLNRSVFVKEKL